MPFLPQNAYSDEELQKKQGQPQNISGGSGTFSLPGASQSANAPKPQGKSGSFANLNEYLDANRDNSAKMGQDIANSVGSVAQQAQDKINTFSSNAPQAVAKLSNDDLNSNYYGKVTSLSDTDKQNYGQLKSTGGYSGPSDISKVAGFDDALSSSQTASQKLAQTQTEDGRQNLLKEQYARPNYSLGQNLLDQTLVQNDQGAKAAIQGVQGKFSNLNEYLDSVVQDKGNVIQQNLKTALDNKAQIGASEALAEKSILDPIDARARQLQEQQDALKGQLADGKGFTDDQIRQILGGQDLFDISKISNANQMPTDLPRYLPDGITTNPDLWNRLGYTFGVNAGNYYVQPNVDRSSAANADEFSKYAALEALIGGQNASALDPSKTGTATAPTFDAAAYNNARNAARVQFESEAAKTRFVDTAARDAFVKKWGFVPATQGGKVDYFNTLENMSDPAARASAILSRRS